MLPGRLRGDVAGDAAGEAELLEQPLHPLRVLADVRVDLAVGAFEVGVGDQRRAAVPRADDVDHVQVVALDDPVEVDAEHVQARRRAPVAEQPRLDVLALQRLLQERVVEQVDLADRQVVGGPPVGVHLAELVRREAVPPGSASSRGVVPRGGWSSASCPSIGSVTGIAAVVRSRRPPRRIDLSRDHGLLVGPDDPDPGRASRRSRSRGSPAAFPPGVEGDPEESEPLAGRRRISGEFSPMPPEKTSVSSPPRTAASAPTHFRAR